MKGTEVVNVPIWFDTTEENYLMKWIESVKIPQIRDETSSKIIRVSSSTPTRSVIFHKKPFGMVINDIPGQSSGQSRSLLIIVPLFDFCTWEKNTFTINFVQIVRCFREEICPTTQ